MKSMKQLVLFAICAIVTCQAHAQKTFTHADTLRGSLSPLRSYDVKYYDLTVRVDIDDKSIAGNNLIRFKATEDMERMQIDLFANMEIYDIYYHGASAQYTRDGNAIFVNLLNTVKEGATDSIRVLFKGHPTVAKHAPWDGGFVWSTDSTGKPWVGVACEGLGASCWWPNKDYQGDKPDSMKMHVNVPEGLVDVSNGHLAHVNTSEGRTVYDWYISYPINNYNVTLNIAAYDHFKDWYISGKDSLALDYYVLPYNRKKAEEQFKQVKPMMKCYEQYLGRYPFWKDGYKLVETSYLGMEHQTAVAYGNQYKTGYAGTDYSKIGLDFDYIIIHESGHEWWGNNVSAADLADMWIHEGFCTYSEAIYVECMFDSVTAMKYVNAKKNHIGNKAPIISHYGVNEEGNGDMYAKGMMLLNTLRFLVDNDTLWWSVLKGIQKDFSLKPTTTAAIENYISQKTGKDLKPIFDQYLRNIAIPVFEYEIKTDASRKLQLNYHWKADVAAFNLPIRVKVAKNKYELIYPTTTEMKTLELKLTNAKDFEVDTDHAYVDTKIIGEEKK